MNATAGLHLGVQLGTAGVTWPELRDTARRVEELGYDSLWVPDHLIAREGRSARLEAWQLLAALALVTARIRIGPLVSPVTFRHPAVLAKMAVTLDHISGGRAILGLGAGGMAREHREYGLRFATPLERSERLEESAALIRSLLDAPTTTFSGTHYRTAGAVAEPKPLQPHLPLLVAGAGRRTMRVAARYADMWNMIGLPPAFARSAGVLKTHLHEHGRDPARFLATASLRLIVREDAAGIRERIEQLDPVWREDPYRFVGTAEEVADRLREYVRVGAGGVIVQMPAPFDRATLETLAAQVRSTLLRNAN